MPIDERPLQRNWVREVDRRAMNNYGMTGLVLMENAARGAVEVMMKLGYQNVSFAICCGKGNNGGDGFAVARHLDALSMNIQVFVFCHPTDLRGDAAANFTILQNCDVPLHYRYDRFDTETLEADLQESDVIVDCLLGTGATGEPRAPLDAVIRHLNRHQDIIAIDVPSGLDCDTGEPATTTIRAKNTITFVAPKPGFANPKAKDYVGQLHIVDIGVPRKLLTEIYAEAYP
jgi:NAD(P)H-hydrate epimerase